MSSIVTVCTDWACGNDLRLFWRLYYASQRAHSRFVYRVLSYLSLASARHHGGYIGPGAVIEGIPSLPHGLHGVYISRYAHIGSGCRIYQNVTIGEVAHKAPRIGRGCLIGAGSVMIGDISIGDGARIGAGAVVACDVPAGSTVISQPARIRTGGRHDR